MDINIVGIVKKRGTEVPLFDYYIVKKLFNHFMLKLYHFNYAILACARSSGNALASSAKNVGSGTTISSNSPNFQSFAYASTKLSTSSALAFTASDIAACC